MLHSQKVAVQPRSIAKRDVCASAARPVSQVGAVAAPPVQSATLRLLRPKQATNSAWQQQQPRLVQFPSLQRAPRPQHQQQQQQQQLQQQCDVSQAAMPAWADRFRRQVRSLPQGQAALRNLLLAADHLLQKAEHCGSHSAVMKGYLSLGLVDLCSQAWQQRAAQLETSMGSNKLPAEQLKQQQLEAVLALAGCRYLRIEAREELAKQLHILLDDEGYCPSLNLGALPAPHALGLPVPKLLRQGLGVDLQNPEIRPQLPTSGLSNLSWDEYSTVSADQSMCGDWQFCYWVGDATWVPAPFGKFSTAELAATLTSQVVVSSLPNCIWGRALVTAAQEQGLPVDTSSALAGQQQQQQQQRLPVQQQLAGAVSGMPEAVKQLLEDSMAGTGSVSSSSNFQAHVRQFSAAVAAVRSAMLGNMPAPGTSAQGN